jgi:hypothetical protein
MVIIIRNSLVRVGKKNACAGMMKEVLHIVTATCSKSEHTYYFVWPTRRHTECFQLLYVRTPCRPVPT